MHEYIIQFTTIAVVHLFAVASPGPDFAIIVKHSLQHGKKVAIITSAGIACGLLFHTAYCILGLGVIISESIVVFNILKLIMACYLIFLGYKGLRAKKTEMSLETKDSGASEISSIKAFTTGFLTNGLNPKATMFLLSLFTVVITPETPVAIQIFYGVYIAVATAIWFTGLSFIFGHIAVRNFFKRFGHWVDRCMGGILVLLGIKIAISDK